MIGSWDAITCPNIAGNASKAIAFKETETLLVSDKTNILTRECFEGQSDYTSFRGDDVIAHIW